MTILLKYWKTALLSAAGQVGDNPLFMLDFDAAQTEIVALLEQARAHVPILDVETHRAPIDEVIADLYQQWRQ